MFCSISHAVQPLWEVSSSGSQLWKETGSRTFPGGLLLGERWRWAAVQPPKGFGHPEEVGRVGLWNWDNSQSCPKLGKGARPLYP